MNDSTTTAYVDWDERWRTETGRADWLVPEEEVIERARAAYATGARRALDLGCGVGRHALALADAGFEVDAFDASRTGLAEVAAKAEEHGLSIATHQGNMTKLPFDDGQFDFIVSWNVIYHGDDPALRQAIAEIHRVLRPGGTMLVTMLSKRHETFGVGEEISKNTWVDADAESDKAHPHYYCDARETVELFDAFDIRSLVDVEQRGKPGNGHWHIVAERLA